jgi:starvation-inducible DNA-binding protein
MHHEGRKPSDETRSAVVESLNRRLADAIDLQLQAKQAHWNVKGPNFIALHDLFERVAVNLAQHADLLAERAVQLGGVVEAVAQAVADRSELPRFPARITSGRDHVMALTNALSAFGGMLRPGIAEAEEAGDPATADILTEVARDIDKLRWLVEAHAGASN